MPDPVVDLRISTIKEISDILTQKEIIDLVRAATGVDPTSEWVSEKASRSEILSETLIQLEKEGRDRWVLTYILIAKASETLRRRIVSAWPKTLIRLPQAEEQVATALAYVNTALKTPLSIDLKFELAEKQQKFEETCGRIAALYAYKSLHEYLHQLDLKLTFEEIVQLVGATSDFNGIALRCDEVVMKIPSALELLSPKSRQGKTAEKSEQEKAELRWVDQLKAATASLKSAAAASDIATCTEVFGGIQGFVRFHLKRLNRQVFKAAIALSFESLMEELPDDARKKIAFEDLKNAIRNLKTTVMARALKHNLWQEVENDISVLQDFFNIPGDEVADVSQSWFFLKRRVLWLADLDPDDPWAKQVLDFTDEISDAILDKKRLDNEAKAHFERYRNLFRFRFLAMDNTMKRDCGSLRKIDGPLTEVLKELAS